MKSILYVINPHGHNGILLDEKLDEYFFFCGDEIFFFFLPIVGDYVVVFGNMHDTVID